jgi:hypothetical protein
MLEALDASLKRCGPHGCELTLAFTDEEMVLLSAPRPEAFRRGSR